MNKAANDDHMMAIYFMHYDYVPIYENFESHAGDGCRRHFQLWEMSDMVKVLEDREIHR